MGYSELATTLRKIVDGNESVLFIDPSLLSAAADAIEALICEAATEHNARLDAENREKKLWNQAAERLPELKMEALEEEHAADVREVVLCRDCKWTKTDGMDDPAIYCMQWDRWEMPPDGFCWLGKKREES